MTFGHSKLYRTKCGKDVFSWTKSHNSGTAKWGIFFQNQTTPYLYHS